MAKKKKPSGPRVFTACGPTGSARAEALLRAVWPWRYGGSPARQDAGTTVYVIVTLAGRGGIERAVDYAAEELRRGVSHAGGTLGDGTHVQITQTPPRPGKK
jgi:hypothetical protein